MGGIVCGALHRNIFGVKGRGRRVFLFFFFSAIEDEKQHVQ